MTERHAILTAIRENPDDDLPRLIYADWLDEHGEPERAELIRVAVAAARDGNWIPGVIPTPGIDNSFLPTNRGIMEEFVCEWRWWRDHGDAIWERELPWRVRLTTRPDISDLHYECMLCRAVQEGSKVSYQVGSTYRVAGATVGVLGNEPMATERILRARWPGIEFELPPVRHIHEGPGDRCRRCGRDIRDDVHERMALPRG